MAVYVNSSYSVNDELTLNGGFRYTDNETVGGQFNYRAGFIYRLSESYVLKGLYATSFRSANLFERYVASAPILQGDESLQNEELKGLDVGLYYNGKRAKASINYYSNQTENFIKRRAINGIPTYVNLPDGEKTTGLEAEVNYFFSKELSVFANAAHSLSAKDSANNEDLKFVVDDMVNVGLSYKPNDDLTFSASGSYRSDWGESPSFSIVNLHGAYKTTIAGHPATLSLSIDNVFDKHYTYAEFSRGKLDTIPGGAPRRLYAALSMAF